MLSSRTRPEVASPDEPTVQLARKRFARRQWARRWLTWRPLLVVAGLVGVLLGLVWLVLFSSVLAVAGVDVEGTSVLRSQEVRRVADVPAGEPLASVDLEMIAARVETLAPVKSADVSRAWPDRVHIAVEERVPVAVVERDGVFRALDADGVQFTTFRSAPPGLPVVRSSAGTRTEALAEAATVVSVLPEDIARRVRYVEVRTVDTISLRLRNGRTVLWGSADQSASKAEVLAVLMEQQASVYDVSVPAAPTLTPDR